MSEYPCCCIPRPPFPPPRPSCASALNIVDITGQSVNGSTVPVSFALINAQLGAGITFSLPGTDIYINEPGVYSVAYSSSVSAADNIATTASMALQLNGTMVTGSTSTTSVGLSNNIETLGAQVLITVAAPSVLQLLATGTSATNSVTFTGTSLVVVKLGI